MHSKIARGDELRRRRTAVKTSAGAPAPVRQAALPVAPSLEVAIALVLYSISCNPTPHKPS